MNIVPNACPNCGKQGGLTKVGETFEHRESRAVEVEKKVVESLLAPVKVNDDGTILTMPTKLEKTVKVVEIQDVKQLGTGSFCTKCNWSQRDKVSTPYQASCAGCGVGLGDWSHGEEASPKAHYCQDCSEARVKAGTHDVDEAVVTFAIKCAGCQEPLNFISFPEGRIDPPKYMDLDQFCQKESCQKKVPAAILGNELAKELAKTAKAPTVVELPPRPDGQPT